MKPKHIQDVLRVASEAALRAGKLVRANAGHLRTGQIQAKSANNFVTEIDRHSERLILDAVRRHFPEHGFLAEESGEGRRQSEITWIIDPIDGTSNFIHGYPLFSISIGVAERDRLVAGVVYDPANDELFAAGNGLGCRLNKKRVRVSLTRRLGDALLVTGIPFRGFKRFEPYMKSLKNLSLGSAGMRRGGSAALDLAYVACGRLDGYWEMGLSPWDIAAGSLLVQEAGGEVSDLQGGETWLKTGDILATNKKIHATARRITQAIPPRT